MRSSLLKSVIVTELQAAEAHSSLDLTKAVYSISKLSARVVEQENVSVRINPCNFIACEKEGQCDDENEVYRQYVYPDP
jgi:hypothetical protein